MLKDYIVLSQKEVGIDDLNVEENGNTFIDNAIIKDFKDIELYKDCFFSAMALSSINLMKLFLEPIISKYKALSRYKSALELIEKYINVKKEIELIW